MNEQDNLIHSFRMNRKIMNERNFINQIVFETQPRGRKIMLISRQNCTSPGSCREIPDSGDRVREH